MKWKEPGVRHPVPFWKKLGVRHPVSFYFEFPMERMSDQ